MKKLLKHSSVFLTGCIAMLIITLLAGCKDSKEVITYDRSHLDGQPFEVTNATGRLFYNSTGGFWTIYFDNPNSVFKMQFGIEEGEEVHVTNLQPYQDYMSGRIRTSGYLTYKKNYWDGEPGIGVNVYVFNYEIAKLESLDASTKTRASINDSLLICGTPAPEPPTWIFTKHYTTNQNLREYNVRVFVHIVRSSKKVGLSAGISSDIIEQLNSYYKNTNLSFTLKGYNYIDNDDYNQMTMSDSDAATLFSNDHKKMLLRFMS